MILKSLLALGLVASVALEAGAHAQEVEAKADILFFSVGGQDAALVEHWSARGFRVHVIDSQGELKSSAAPLSPSTRKLLVAGSRNAGKFAVEFCNQFAPAVAGLILIEPEISGREELSSSLPILIERIDDRNQLKLWIDRQFNLGLNVHDVRFPDPEQLQGNLAIRITAEFINAVLAGSLKRVVP